MRKLALSTLVIMLAASCATQKIVTSERYEVKKGRFNYQKYTPLDFLEYLGLRYKETIGEHGPGVITVVIVWNVPDSWISRKDVEKLANLLDSSERCAGTVMPISSHLPLSSTVGQEATFLIEGFRKGKYPPAHSSDSIDKDSIRKWIVKDISTNK